MRNLNVQKFVEDIYIYMQNMQKYIKYIMIVRWSKMFKFHTFNWNDENVHLHKNL